MEHYPKRLRHGSGHLLVLDEERVLVFLKRARTPTQVERAVNKVGFTCTAYARAVPEEEAQFAPINDSDRSYWLQRAEGRPITGEELTALRGQLGASFDFIAPVYRVEGTEGEGGLVSPLPNRLLIKPKENISESDLKRLLSSLSDKGLEEEPGRSKYLGGYREFRVTEPDRHTAYTLREQLLDRFGKYLDDVKFENVPLVTPITFIPNDPFFSSQWNLSRINAPAAWDISVGEPEVVVAVLDSGCDLSHPDITYASNGVNLGSMSGTGAPVGSSVVRGHGTCCAGIVAANVNNALGVAGMAGGCRILPIAFQNWSDVEVAAGIRFATQGGAEVLSMSFGQYGPGEGVSPSGWDFSVISPAINEAIAAGLVLCAATGNQDINTFNIYPARHPLVMACGGSSTDDNRKSNSSLDGECWGANFAAGVSVVAPCVTIPTTDIQGSDGYNDNSGGSKTQACVPYPSSGDSAGNFYVLFDGTSAATPHVAGLAALVFSASPLLVNRDVRDIIEQTAARVGSVAYSNQSGFPNGPRNQPMGYGRIDVAAAVETAGLLFVRQFNEFFNP